MYNKPKKQTKKINHTKNIKQQENIHHETKVLNKKAVLVNTKSLPKVILKNQSLYNELLKIHAYVGDSSLRSHYTQESFVYAYRNDYALYDLHQATFGLKKAFHFLKKQKLESLILIGCPKPGKEKTELFFKTKKIQFFPSNEWQPGFISKKAYSISRVVIIYDITFNANAKFEAFNAKFPIVGFFTIYADIHGVDYPISLNLENSGTWYMNLWKTFFLIK